MRDDGIGGDATPDDGIYSTTITSTDETGRYRVIVAANKQGGGGSALNRSAETDFWSLNHPDLEILPGDIQLSDVEIGGQAFVRVTGTFRNIGDVVAEQVKVLFQERETQAVFGDTVVAHLDIGSDVTLTGFWPVRSGLPAYDLGLRVDVISGPVENSFDNNAAFATELTPRGACCLPDGNCALAIESECCHFHVAGQNTTCDPNPCPEPIGACCLFDGYFICGLTTFSGCYSGDWRGPGTTCEPNPCPGGACCYGGGECVFTMEEWCGGSGRAWLGVGSHCEPNPCFDQGACCDPGSGACVVTIRPIARSSAVGTWK